MRATSQMKGAAAEAEREARLVHEQAYDNARSYTGTGLYGTPQHRADLVSHYSNAARAWGHAARLWSAAGKPRLARRAKRNALETWRIVRENRSLGNLSVGSRDRSTPTVNRKLFTARSRDVDDAPPSTQRVPRTKSGYRFAVEAKLVREHRMTDARAARLVHKWQKLVDSRREMGRTPSSTAEHVARFERQHLVSPYPRRDRTRSWRRR